jgi:S1-C subfamily serine protease
LKPSVYKVEALLGDGTSQGSAVAVSATELLTNCHVVEGARKILIHQDKREFVAKLSRSRPSADRCVLTADGAAFTPVRGVRSYSDLKVGESLYTLGAPANLELSLSNGIVSGLRSDDPTGRFVQTTAPISPGSSGGGLFDSRGNLVGITTLVKVDRRRLNQSLNFAIAAEDFWQK